MRAPAPVRALKYVLSREGLLNSSGHSILFWKQPHWPASPCPVYFLWICVAIRCCSTFDRLYAYIRGVMGKANSLRRLLTLSATEWNRTHAVLDVTLCYKNATLMDNKNVISIFKFNIYSLYFSQFIK